MIARKAELWYSMIVQFYCEHLQGTTCVPASAGLTLVRLVAAPFRFVQGHRKAFNRLQSSEWSRNPRVAGSSTHTEIHEERRPVRPDVSDMVIAGGVHAWDS